METLFLYYDVARSCLRSIRVVHKPKCKGPFTTDYWERRSYARGCVSHTVCLAHGNRKGKKYGRKKKREHYKEKST